MRSTSGKPRHWVLPIVAALAGSPLLAQTPQADESPSIFVDRVDVNVVNIEVFVFDKAGNRVTGLTKDDFEILEDGQPVEITNFFTVARRQRLERSLEKARLPEESTPSDEIQLLPADRQLNLVVYIDHFNLRPSSRNRVLDDLAGFLEDRTRIGDNVMLVGAFRGAEVVMPFTRDWRTVAVALRKMRKMATHRQDDEAEIRRAIMLMRLAAAEGSANNAYNHVRSYVQSSRSDLRRSVVTLRDTVRSLAGLPGRKALLYVSEGLPQRPGEELYEQLQQIFGSQALRGANRPGAVIDPSIEALREDQTRLFNNVVREANAHQVTFYTVDASGPGMTSLSASIWTGAVAGPRTVFDALRKQNLQQPLIEMAEATGGSSILNSFNFDEVLHRLAGDFDGFYSLGYSPAVGGDGTYREIKVRVKSPGFEVRHRSGYVSKAPAETIADRTLSSLLFGLEKNPLEVEIDFGDWKKTGRNKFDLPVLVRVPFRRVTLLPGNGTHEGRLKIYMAVKDEEGAISDIHQESYPLEVPAARLDEALGKEVGYMVTLQVRGGLPKVAVGVWDELSGVDSFVHKQTRVGRKKGQPLR